MTVAASGSGVSVLAEGLGKRYRLGASMDSDASLVASAVRAAYGPVRNFRHLRSLRRFGDEDAPNVVWAIRDVSFEARQGEVLGVIGRNGAGKSTLLKVLARITEPSEGEAELRGRVSSLLEVGTGFHPDLTGRDNVYLKGTMLGMTRREVAARFDDIVEYAELGQFIDTPVKRFSSGMYVRLAFAVAAHLDPDVLIADEVLAVGDAEFQRRSVGTMRSAAEENGRTVIFVSHDLSVVSSLCTRAIWLDRGRLRAEGDVDEVIDRYMHSLEHEQTEDLAHRADRIGNGAVRVTRVAVQPVGGTPTGVVAAGSDVEVRVQYETDGRSVVDRIEASIVIETLLREKVATLSTELSGDELSRVSGTAALVCTVDDLPLNEGDYMCTVRLEVDGKVADWIADTTRFRVDPSSFFASSAHPGPKGGRLLVRHRWHADD